MLRSCLASDAVLNDAYEWLCHRRKKYPADADVWSFRRNWLVEKKRIQADLLAGEFRFSLLNRVAFAEGPLLAISSRQRRPSVTTVVTPTSDIQRFHDRNRV